MAGRWRHLAFVTLLAVSAITACQAGEAPAGRLFIIGQDLGSIRDYAESECCPAPDGATLYLNFWGLLNEGAGYGGLGIDTEGNPVGQEVDWGGGPNHAWNLAHEFEGGLALGLWMPENDNPGGLARLAAGEYDANIRQLARLFNKIDNPVWLRIGYEFDGGWNQGYENQENYVAAWRRIVDILRAEGVGNVEYVWQAAAFPPDIMADGGYTDIRGWYPGDDYVDWMGLSMFMRLDEGPGVPTEFVPPTARELVGKVLDLARERGKPVFIGEASPQGYDLARGTKRHSNADWDGPPGTGARTVSPEDIWDEWYGPLFGFMEENADIVRALAYINCNWDAQDMWGPPYSSGYWGDTRLQASPEIAQRFTAAIERWRKLP